MAQGPHALGTHVPRGAADACRRTHRAASAVPNIQASWVKLGADGVALALEAGANDLGGTLMDESITRSAGGVHGQELDAAQLTALAQSIGRPARQRTTLYGAVAAPAAEPALHGVAVGARGAAAH